ncbi:MAG TPA: glucose-6-phosphate dehydrogenase assembly protein OpcA [Pyrinomonadaceae bacterium]|jgi:glucose-6-phosphate dehydrogenase assembly protein OpcA|nr:glucose-6-phosphate dehydrogenase assembly protein OpcA [Pyrinomonadaceae bacterium]
MRQQTTHSTPQQIRVSAALDVQAVEHELGQLWKEHTAGAVDVEEDGAVMRARVLNLMVYVSSQAALDEVNKLLSEITSAHPCRALVMVAQSEQPDQDIEMFVSAHCLASGGTGSKNLCGEQVTLKARGRFTVELPSAAVPLLVPDLPVFLWWREAPRLHDQTFANLTRASDRIVIDSAAFRRPYEEILELVALLERQRREHAALSDLNWARLTSWRMLLASFYDVAEYRPALSSLDRVRIEYVAHELAPGVVAPKALILAGWLASRLGWRTVSQQTLSTDETGVARIALEQDSRRIDLEFAMVERSAAMQGWIARIELMAESASPQKFVVLRSEDGRYLETEVIGGGESRASRISVGGDKSEAELLERELEIVSHDRIYEEAITAAARMLGAK